MSDEAVQGYPDLQHSDPEEEPIPETKEPEAQNPHKVPDGGARAWMVVLGAMMVNGCSFGYASSFGVYQDYYLLHQLSNKSSSEIAWIGSFQLFFMFTGGLFAGALFDRYGARRIMVPASFFYILAIMFTSLCKEYYQFILAQGVFAGLANGMIFLPSVSAVGHYFDKKRGAAFGLIAVGSSLGGVLIPIALENAFYSHVGFAWGVRALGFVFLVLLGISCILVVERLPPRATRFVAPEAFRQPVWIFVTAGVFFIIWGVFVVYFFVSEYAVEKVHTSTSLAFYLISILSGASLIGRTFFGFSADKAGVLNVLTGLAVINGVMIFTWTQTSTSGGLIGWCVVFGISSGGIFSLFPAALASTAPSPQVIGIYLGQSMGVIGFAALSGSPIAGAILERYGFTASGIFGGVSMLVGAAFVFCGRYTKQSRLSIKA